MSLRHHRYNKIALDASRYASISSIMGLQLVPTSVVLYNSAMRILLACWLCAIAIQLGDRGWAQLPGRTPSTTVGASMALLATLQDADVLPPEGTAEANRVVHIVIQLQSAFMKSTDPAIGALLRDAFSDKWGPRGEEFAVGFRSRGWNSEALEALSDRYASLTAEQRQALEGGLSRFNMRTVELEYLMSLFDRARKTFAGRNQDIHHVFAEHRRVMPGGGRRHKKEDYHGNQGVHLDQSESGTDKRRSAIPEETAGGGAGPFLFRAA